MTIPFNQPPKSRREREYVLEVLESGKLSGDGPFTRRCHAWLREKMGSHGALLTTSCTMSLDMAALLADIAPGDEVVMPSFTFVSTANAVVLRGGVPVFVDIRPDTLNLDETLLEGAITDRTRALFPVHYGGIACDMDPIMALAERRKLIVVEDAAQGFLARYKGRPLGSIGHLGAFSFHETKNVVAGEAGALMVNDQGAMHRAEIIREKGTDRSRFLRGEVDKYSWVDVGSSFLPSELTAAMLLAQLEEAEEITARRVGLWERYHQGLPRLADRFDLSLARVPEECEQNGHIVWLLLPPKADRGGLIRGMKERGVGVAFHFVPLHSSLAGRRFGRVAGSMEQTESYAARLVRLPIFADMTMEQVDTVLTVLEEVLGKL